MRLNRVCVFCGSNAGVRAAYAEGATLVGKTLARRGLEVVYGGGHVGLMGIVADAALAEGGRVIGVIPEALVRRELAHKGLTELRIVESMHERKAMMAELSDGFIALPGGFGTFEEFCEILTWAQLGLHQKPCGLLNLEAYYEPLLQLFDAGVREGFIPAAHREWVLVHSEPDSLLNAMQEFRAPSAAKWISSRQT